jgi:hypothetical protein
MAHKDNILQELNDLGSTLVNQQELNVYQAPNGYFADFPEYMLKRIKALKAGNATEEINYLSPFLSNYSKTNPYSVPPDYFENVDTRISQIMGNTEKLSELSASEELDTLSPLLGGLKKQLPYSVPDGYFENLSASSIQEKSTPQAKVVSIGSRKWFRYAAAAAIISFVTIGAFLFINKKETINPETNSYAWVKKSLNKVSTEEIDAFISVSEKENAVASVSEKPNEVQDLVQTISDKELQDFLDETALAEQDNDEDLLLN